MIINQIILDIAEIKKIKKKKSRYWEKDISKTFIQMYLKYP